MKASQNSDSTITVRRGHFSAYNCLFKLWGETDNGSAVYQLKQSSNGKRAKVILVEGA